VRGLDRIYRRQVLSLASIDRYVRVVVRELRRTGQLDNTYLVFTSDNGLHLGHHRMFNVKNFAYEKDSHMPFAIRGPGIEPGTVVGQVTGNIDLAPTLADIAGHALGFPHDGESLLPLAEGLAPKWRNYYFVTRGLPFSGTARPDKVPRTPARRQVQPPGLVRYSAVISARWQYIRWATGDEELYDGARDPYQVRNVLARPPEDRTELEQRALEEHRVALSRLRGCAGPEECRVQ
jgi:arylsulfatase A-like enzyme